MAVGGAEQFQYILDIVAQFNEASVLEGLRAIEAETEKLRSTAAKVSAGGGGNYSEAIRQVAALEAALVRVKEVAASVNLSPQAAGKVEAYTKPGAATTQVASNISSPVAREKFIAGVQAERAGISTSDPEYKSALRALTNAAKKEAAVHASSTATAEELKVADLNLLKARQNLAYVLDKQAVAAGTQLYHGTTTNDVPGVQRKGLIPQKGVPGVSPATFASTDPGVALAYAERAARLRGGEPAVIQFAAPEGTTTHTRLNPGAKLPVAESRVTVPVAPKDLSVVPGHTVEELAASLGLRIEANRDEAASAELLAAADKKAAAAEETYYQGTTSKRLSSINKQGLVPGAFGAVHATPNYESALAFAQERVRLEGGTPSVVAFKNPVGSDEFQAGVPASELTTVDTKAKDSKAALAAADERLAAIVAARAPAEERATVGANAVAAANETAAAATVEGAAAWKRVSAKGATFDTGAPATQYQRDTASGPYTISKLAASKEYPKAGYGVTPPGATKPQDVYPNLKAAKAAVDAEIAALAGETAAIEESTVQRKTSTSRRSVREAAVTQAQGPDLLQHLAGSRNAPETATGGAAGGKPPRITPPPPPPEPPPDDETPEQKKIRQNQRRRELTAAARAEEEAQAAARQKALDDEALAEQKAQQEKVKVAHAKEIQAVTDRARNARPPGSPLLTEPVLSAFSEKVVGAREQADVQQQLAGDKGYTDSVAQVRLALQQQSAAIERTLATEGEIFAEGKAYATALAETRIYQAKTNAAVNIRLAEEGDYAKSLAENKIAQRQVKAQTELALLEGNAYIQATAELANARRALVARSAIEESTGAGFEKVTPRGFLYPDQGRVDPAEADRRKAYGLEQLAQLEGSSKALAQYRKAQVELVAVTERQLISSKIAEEQALKIAGDKRTEAQLIAQRRTIEAQLAADLEGELAYNEQYKKAAAELALLKRQRAAAEKASLESSLAADKDYIAATAEANLAQRLKAVRIKEQELTGGRLNRVTKEGLEVPEGQGIGLHGLIESENAIARRVVLEKARVTIAEQGIGYSEAEVAEIAQAKQLEAELNRVLKTRVAAAQRAAYEQIRGTSADKSSAFQRFQADAQNRRDTTNFRNPAEFAQLGSFLKSKFLTTAGFAVSGVVTYAAFSGIQRMVSDSSQLERVLSQVRAQFEALGEGSAVDGFIEGIKEISRESGEAAADVAKIAFQFKGAFGDKTNSAVLKEAESAVKISRVTGLSLEEVTDSLTSTALNYGESIDHIGGATLTLQDQTGVLAKHIITAIADLAPVAEEVGLKMEKIGAIAAVAQKKSGQSGAVLAESLNRILPTIGENSGELIQFFRQNRPGEADAVLNALATGQTGQVFDIIGRDYDKLTGSQQKYVQSLLGTKKDLKGLIPVFNEYGEVIRLTSIAEQEKGRLDKSYAALQQTLSQQLQRVAAAFKNIGQALLSLGVSETIQNLAKVIGVVVVAASDFVQIFATINNVMGGLPSKVLAVVATILVLTKALAAYRKLAIGTAITQGITSIPGRIVGTAPKVGAAASVVAAGADVGGTGAPTVVTPPVVVPPVTASRFPKLEETRAKIPGNTLEKGIIGFGGRVKESVDKSTGLINAAKSRMGGALTSMGQTIQTLVPIAAIMLTIQAITNAIQGYQQTKQKLEDLRSQFLSEGGTDTKQGQKDLAEYAKEREKALNGKVSVNPLKNVKTLFGQVAALGQKSASDVSADAVQQNTTQAFAKTLRTQLSGDQLKSALKEANAANIVKNGPGAKQLDEKDLARIAKEGTTDNKEFQAVIDLFTTSAKFKEGLGHAYNAVLNDQKEADGKVAELNANLDSLPTLLIKADVGIITPQEFQSKAQETKEGLIDALNVAIAKRSDPELINSLKSQLDQTSQALDQSISKFLTNQVAAKGIITSLSGAGNLQTLQATLKANTAALGEPGALTSSVAPQLAQAAVQAQKDIVKYMLDHAKSNAEARRLLEEGIPVAKDVADALEIDQLRSGLPEDVSIVLTHSAAALGKNFDDVLKDIVTAKGGIKEGIKALIAELLKAIEKLVREGKGDSKQADRLRSHAANLKAELGKPFFEDITHLKGTPTEPSTPDEDAAAQAALKGTLYGSDPLVAAQIARDEAARKLKVALRPGSPTNNKAGKIAALDAIAAADKQYKEVSEDIASSYVDLAAAQAEGDPVKVALANIAKANLAIQQAKGKGTAAENAAKAQLIQANLEYENAIQAIGDANFSVLLAMSDGDVLSAAQIAVAQANAQAANAHGEAERLQALAAQINAQHQVRDALFAIADAQSNLLIAIATAAGDTVEAAQLSLQHAKDVLARDLARGLKETDPRVIQDRQNVVEQEAALRDTTLNDATSDINFLLSTHKISNAQAIARLKTLNQAANLTKAEHHQLEQQIYDLQHQAQQDLQFNLPTDIKLPTLYEARRFNEGGGGGSNYQDNRVISIQVSTNAKLDGNDINRLTTAVTNEVQAPPRFGNRRGAY